MQFTELHARGGLVIGEQNAIDGSVITQRGGRLGDGIVSQLNGKYFEAAFHRRMFYSHCSAVAMSAPATTNLGNIVWNPVGSGYLLSLTKWSLCYQVDDANALAADLCYQAQAVIPVVATAATVGCTYLLPVGTTGGIAKAFAAAAVTTIPIPIYRLALFAAAFKTKGMDKCEGDFGGGIIVPPGYIVTINTLVAAAALGVTSTLWWEEIPIQ